ncbi:hypothetical protein D9M71_813170 [compost metagenome]
MRRAHRFRVRLLRQAKPLVRMAHRIAFILRLETWFSGLNRLAQGWAWLCVADYLVPVKTSSNRSFIAW